MNREAHRRANIIARKSGLWRQPQSNRLRNMLLASAATGALMLAQPASVSAQTVVPPSAGPCVVVGTTATCTGDVSAGVDANAPLTILNVNNLNQAIMPAGIDGINFDDGGAATGVTINVNT